MSDGIGSSSGERRRGRTWFTIGAVVALAVMFAGYMLLFDQRRAQSSADDPLAFPEQPAPTAASGAPTVAEVRVSAPLGDGASLRVVNATGVAIPDAVAVCHPGAYALFSSTSVTAEHAIARSGPAGEMTLSAETVKDRSCFLSVHKDGFASAVVGMPPPKTVTTVVLNTAVCLDVEIVDTKGRPVPNIDVVLSKAALPSAAEAALVGEPRLLLRPEATGGAVYHAASDTKGRVELRGLVPASYGVTVECGQQPYVLSPPFQLGDGIDLRKKQSLRVVLQEVWGCAIRVTTDVVLAHLFRTTEADRKLWLRADHAGRCKLLTSLVGSRFRNALVYVSVPDATLTEDKACAELVVAGRASGWTTHTVRMVPLSQLNAAEDLSMLGRPVSVSGSLVLTIHDHIGRPVAGADRFRLTPVGRDWQASVAAVMGQPMELPAGSYKLVYGDYFFPRGLLPEGEIVVQAGQTTAKTVFLSGPARRYSWRIRLPDGERTDKYVLSFYAPGHGSLALPHSERLDGGERGFWFAPGPVRFHVYVFGYQPFTGNFTATDRESEDAVVEVTVGRS